MGVQSTRIITRKEAEHGWVHKMINSKEVERYFRKRVLDMSNEELEDALESTFDNYKIVKG